MLPPSSEYKSKPGGYGRSSVRNLETLYPPGLLIYSEDGGSMFLRNVGTSIHLRSYVHSQVSGILCDVR
jgi:hypothetical protein